MCHENYAPLEIKLVNNNSLTVAELEMDFDVEVVPGVNVEKTDEENYEPQDKQYKENGWLAKDGCRPVSVSFLNGRLVFAATRDNRQRVFASAVKKDEEKNYNFSTYKRFLTEKREYSALYGSIQPSDTKIINSQTNYIINAFKKPPDQYCVDSQLLYKKGTRVLDASFSNVYLDDECLNPKIILNAELIKKDIEEKIKLYESYEANNKEDFFYKADWQNGAGIINTDEYYQHEAAAVVRAGSLIIKFYYERKTRFSQDLDDMPRINNGEITIRLDGGNIKNIIDGNTAGVILKIKSEFMNAAVLKREAHSNDLSHLTEYYYESIFDICISRLFSNVINTMHYKLPEEYGEKDLYGDPQTINSEALALIYDKMNAFFAIYTREIICDEYPTPDCGFTFEVASDANDAIRFLAVNKGLIIGTEMGEFFMPPDTHAGSVYVVSNSRYGSAAVQAAAVGNATVFFQSGKKSLTEYYPNENDHFRANNMAMLNPGMLSESGALEIDFVSAPYTKLLITREDGTMATLLYERNTGTFAWGRITTGPEIFLDTRSPEYVESLKKTGRAYSGERSRSGKPSHECAMPERAPVLKRVSTGKIISAAVLPGYDGNDDAYLIVKRNEQFFLERLRENCGVYLDCFQKITPENRAQIMKQYGEGAVFCRVYMSEDDGKGEYEPEVLYETVNVTPPPFDRGGEFYIGYPYSSLMRTMPVLANDKMKKQRIVELAFRFMESYMPEIKSFVAGKEKGGTRFYGKETPFTGICKKSFPGDWDEEVQAEIGTDIAAPVCLLAINAVLQGGQ
jgi:hypothetical protein